MKNRKELINDIHAELELTKKDIEAVVHKYEEKIAEALSNGIHVNLHGFGKLELRERAARTGRNPQTGEPIEIPPTVTVGFKPSSVLKDAVKSADTEQK
jgi:DNA-binding protein HU-beta